MAKLVIGQESKPRYEFRAFGRDFEETAYLMSRLSTPVPEKVWERTSEEIYIVSRTNNVNNTKIRDGKMDIKTFVQEKDGLEQWNPLIKGGFPLSSGLLKKEVFPAFMVDVPELKQESYNQEEFLDLVNEQSELQAVYVDKHRFGYMVNNTICEYALVWVNGAMIETVSSESTEIDDILKTISDLNLEGEGNVNYLQAIKRVIGMIGMPF